MFVYRKKIKRLQNGRSLSPAFAISCDGFKQLFTDVICGF